MICVIICSMPCVCPRGIREHVMVFPIPVMSPKLLLTMCVCRPRGFVVVHHQALIDLRSLIKRQAHFYRFLPTPLVQVPAAAPTKAHGDTKDEIDGYEVIPNALASLADSAPQKTV